MTRIAAVLLLAVSLWGQAPPTITRITQNGNNPTQLSPGTFVYVFGTALGTQPKVAVNGVAATVVGSIDTAAFVQIPASTPVGQASVAVTTSAGTSAPFPIVLAAVSPSLISCACNPTTYYFRGNGGEALYYPMPGDIVEIGMIGLGAALPVPVPTMIVDGNEFPALGTATRGWTNSTVKVPWTSQSVIFKVPDLQPGHHTLAVKIGGATGPSISLDMIYSGIVLSQSGLTFNAVQGGPAPLPQSFSVLSGTGTINFNLTPSTLSGGSWLAVSPHTGSPQAGQLGTPIKVSIDPTGLATGAYYGTIQVSAPNVLNSPQSVTVVLKVAPAGTPLGAFLDTSGLIFLGTQSGGDPPPQAVTIANPTDDTLSFTSTLSITAGTNQWKYSPLSATISSGQSVALSAQAMLKGAAAGVYTARINLAFSDKSTRTVNLLLVVVADTPAKTLAPLEDLSKRDAGGCVPTKLLPVFSQPGTGFNVSAAWPTPILVSVVDDCANALTTGSVNVSFSNGDPPIPMASLRNGSWAATWSAVKPVTTGVTLTATASDPATGLKASVNLGGAVAANPDAPIVNKGGVVDAASNGPALSPGSLITVYGSKLSTGTGPAPGLPWSNSLNNTTVLLGGKALPLYYTSDGQLNAMVPFDVAQNTALQLVARSGNALSSPQPALIVPVRPGVFVMDATGLGAIVRSDGAVAGPTAPAKPGEYVVVYCTGFGPVDPPVTAGVPVPYPPLSPTVNKVTASVGGTQATVLFAGVSPGFSGLYQVNLQVPAGLPDNDATPLILTANGQESAQVIFAVRTPK